MIDVNLPLELDDGRPATFVRMAESGKSIMVSFDGPYDKRHPDKEVRDQSFYKVSGGAFFNATDGRWCGGHPDSNYTLRNVEEACEPEDWS